MDRALQLILEYFGRIDWKQLPGAARDLWVEPSSNRTAAVLFVAALALLLLIFVLLGALFIQTLLSGDDEDDDEYDDDYEYADQETGEDKARSIVASADSTSEVAHAGEAEPVQVPARRLPPYVGRVLIGLLVVAAVVGFDYGSALDAACNYCHENAPHERVTGDPHGGVACVSCHEYRRGLYYLPSAAGRWAHVITAVANGPQPDGYGSITVPECLRCHRDRIEGVLRIDAQELRVSHAEPLQAGAQCVDCHTMDDAGAVGLTSRGMTACLRCHDGKTASNRCDLCHEGDPSAAIRDAERMITFLPQHLVVGYRCYGSCHPDPKPCDSCHGLRMPHAPEFMNIKHAKYAAFEKKQSCFRMCHSNAECNVCHNFQPGWVVSGHDINWTKDHAVGGDFNANCSCHAERLAPGESFCRVCHDEQ